MYMRAATMTTPAVHTGTMMWLQCCQCWDDEQVGIMLMVYCTSTTSVSYTMYQQQHDVSVIPCMGAGHGSSMHRQPWSQAALVRTSTSTWSLVLLVPSFMVLVLFGALVVLVRPLVKTTKNPIKVLVPALVATSAN